VSDPTTVMPAVREVLSLDWASASVVIGFLALLVVGFLAHTFLREKRMERRELEREADSKARTQACEERTAKLADLLVSESSSNREAIANNTNAINTLVRVIESQERRS